MNKRAILYARVSTDDQADKGYSLPSQLDLCRKYAERLGYSVVEELREDYSGAMPIAERPTGKQLAAMVKARSVDAVIVYQVDRLSRDIVNLLATVQMWIRSGIEVHTCDIGKIESELDIVLVIKGWQGSDERKKILERTTRGKRTKVLSGKVTGGGLTPFGYKHVRDENHRIMTFEIVEEEAHIVKMIFRWYVHGEKGKRFSVRRIALRLSEMKIPSPGAMRGLTRRKRAAHVWSPSRVLDILTHEVYAGKWYWNRHNASERLGVDVPAIVDRETFERAQAQRQHNIVNSPRNCKRDYLLRAMVKCECGAAMVGCFGNNLRYYACARRSNHNPKVEERKCRTRRMRADEFELDVWEGIKNFFENQKRLKHLLRIAKQEQEAQQEPKRDELKAVEALLLKTEQDADDCAATMRRAKGRVLESLEHQQNEINARYDELKKRRDELTADIAEQSLTDSAVSDILQYAADVRAGMENADAEMVRRNLERLKLKVTVKGECYSAKCVLGEWEGKVKRWSIGKGRSKNAFCDPFITRRGTSLFLSGHDRKTHSA